jgi:hypothetical protein
MSLSPNETSPLRSVHPFIEATLPNGMRVTYYSAPLSSIPCDFFADPDGRWTYDSLKKAARFTEDGVAIGALKAPFNGHPEGSAVVTLNAETRPYIAIVECPIAYECAEPELELRTTAA